MRSGMLVRAFPSSHHREEGWRRHQENGAQPPYRRRRGGVPCPFERDTTPAERKGMLPDIFLIARPPLLAVMRGGEFAFLKMALNLDSTAFAVDPQLRRTVAYIKRRGRR